MVNSIIEGLTDYFIDCPYLKDGVFRVDALGPEGIEYGIETEICDPIINTFVDGSTERQYQFSFMSREYYSMDRLQNINNNVFYENLSMWVEDQSREGNLPELPTGMTAESMEVISSGYIFDVASADARYSISLRLLYNKGV